MRAGVVLAVLVGIFWNLLVVLPFLLITGGMTLVSIAAGAATP